MIKSRAFRSRALAGATIAAFVILTLPLPGLARGPLGQEQAKPMARQGTLLGTVYSEGMRARVANAVVKIRNLNTQKEFTSPPTDAKGNYKILMIEEGWYTLGVTTPAGDFNLNYGVYIKAGETAKLSVELQPGGMLEGRGGSLAGKKSFFATPGGVLLIVAAAGGAGFGIYELTKKEEEVSPIR
ncbi:MAG: hypothetical protein ABFD52_04585 [Acidobacteriota bacterium]